MPDPDDERCITCKCGGRKQSAYGTRCAACLEEMIAEELDTILDEIDRILEEDIEEFVENYMRNFRGGE